MFIALLIFTWITYLITTAVFASHLSSRPFTSSSGALQWQNVQRRWDGSSPVSTQTTSIRGCRRAREKQCEQKILYLYFPSYYMSQTDDSNLMSTAFLSLISLHLFGNIIYKPTNVDNNTLSQTHKHEHTHTHTLPHTQTHTHTQTHMDSHIHICSDCSESQRNREGSTMALVNPADRIKWKGEGKGMKKMLLRLPTLLMLCHILSYHILSYHITSYHIISYHIISYHIISYHIISYHILIFCPVRLHNQIIFKERRRHTLPLRSQGSHT